MLAGWDYYDEDVPKNLVDFFAYMENRVMVYDGSYTYILRAPDEGRLWVFESERLVDPPAKRPHHYRENWEYDPLTRDRVRRAAPIAHAIFGIRVNPNIGREPFQGWGHPDDRLQ